MVKRFSKNYRNKGTASSTCNPNPKVMSRCLSVPDATSLYITDSRSIVNIVEFRCCTLRGLSKRDLLLLSIQ